MVGPQECKYRVYDDTWRTVVRTRPSSRLCISSRSCRPLVTPGQRFLSPLHPHNHPRHLKEDPSTLTREGRLLYLFRVTLVCPTPRGTKPTSSLGPPRTHGTHFCRPGRTCLLMGFRHTGTLCELERPVVGEVDTSPTISREPQTTLQTLSTVPGFPVPFMSDPGVPGGLRVPESFGSTHADR